MDTPGSAFQLMKDTEHAPVPTMENKSVVQMEVEAGEVDSRVYGPKCKASLRVFTELAKFQANKDG